MEVRTNDAHRPRSLALLLARPDHRAHLSRTVYSGSDRGSVRRGDVLLHVAIRRQPSTPKFPAARHQLFRVRPGWLDILRVPAHRNRYLRSKYSGSARQRHLGAVADHANIIAGNARGLGALSFSGCAVARRRLCGLGYGALWFSIARCELDRGLCGPACYSACILGSGHSFRELRAAVQAWKSGEVAAALILQRRGRHALPDQYLAGLAAVCGTPQSGHVCPQWDARGAALRRESGRCMAVRGGVVSDGRDTPARFHCRFFLEPAAHQNNRHAHAQLKRESPPIPSVRSWFLSWSDPAQEKPALRRADPKRLYLTGVRTSFSSAWCRCPERSAPTLQVPA